jgi:hypothetical protein
MPTRRTFLLSLCLPLLLPGCRTLDAMRGDDMDPRLYERLRHYEGVVRWGDLTQMYGFLKPELAERVSVPEGLGNIRVMGYDAISPPSQVNEDRWSQTIAIQYVLQDQQVVKSLVDLQTWEREPDGEVWYRTSPIPEFR